MVRYISPSDSLWHVRNAAAKLQELLAGFWIWLSVDSAAYRTTDEGGSCEDICED